MNKNTITAFLAASAVFVSLCGCVEQQNSTTTNAPASQSDTITLRKEKTNYFNGTVKNPEFSYFADPALWSYVNSPSDTCELRMITGKDTLTCGVSVFISDEKEKDQSAELKVLSIVNKEEILSTGPLATVGRTFYYYEWAVDEEINARVYLADYGDKYVCAYSECNNFGFVEGKIADLLSTLKLHEETATEEEEK